jgi:uncharacterized membrane protein
MVPEDETLAPDAAAAEPRPRGRVHWHVAFTHLPISLFATAFLFQILHLFMFEKEFELATTVCVITGAASLVPAIISGWMTWKRRYHASTARLFRRKIALGFAMLAVSVPLAVWRVVLYHMDHPLDRFDHYIFFAVTTALIAAAMVEGYLGGRLSHR